MLLLRRIVLGCCALIAGCSSSTQLVVVVDSDLAVPGEIDEVRVTVAGPSGSTTETSQALDGAPLPLTLGVSPSGEALGPVVIVAEGRLDGALVVSRTARTTLVRGESRLLYLFLARSCLGVSCPASQTCLDNGACGFDVVDDLPPWTGVIPSRDGGGFDGGGFDGGADAGPRCERGSDCDDGVACTTDVCDGGTCEHRPDDAACTLDASGVCDPTDGCQYATCTPANCVAGPCQTAACEGTRCMRTNLCPGQACCAGECAAPGCSDGNPCTDDACGASGCENTPNTASCDDGAFCNGADSCSGGTCSTHTGDPCTGAAVCDESAGACVGCVASEDCGPPVLGDWGPCGGFADICSEAGTRMRTVTSFRCSAGACVPSMTTETGSCTRTVAEVSCGATTCGAYGACTYASTCANGGSRTRTCTDLVCSGGECAGVTRTETDTAGCARDTSETLCMATSCGGYGACEPTIDDECTTAGTQSRTCTDYACAGGSCVGTDRAESAACTRSTDGMPCDDGSFCTDSDQCFGGVCNPGPDNCPAPCVCGPGGLCRDGAQICPL